MTVYYGVVRNHVVVLDDDVRLADGVAVEVYVGTVPAMQADYKEVLRARGLLQDSGVPTPAPLPGDRRPITVHGQPLSEMIIAERR